MTRRRRRQSAAPILSVGQMIIIVLLGISIAIGAYFLFGQSAPMSTSMQGSDERVAVRPGDEARALVAEARRSPQGPDLEALLATANRFVDTGKLSDAHLLLFYLAREDQPEAARLLGGLYDPLYFSPDRSIMDQPDPVQAYKWYTKAAQAGDEVARARLAALHAWVKKRADTGDEELRLLLMGWNTESGVEK